MRDAKKIAAMNHAGKILGSVMDEVLASIQPGITELEIDKLAEKLILEKGGMPGFKKVPGYRHTICISVNDVVVHGIPTKRVIAEGDIVGVDCGVFYDGFHTDMAETIRVGGARGDEVDKFLAARKKALFSAIQQAKAGRHVGNISEKMQEGVEREGYSIVRNLVGHGVGRQLHEAPEIPGFVAATEIENTPKLIDGMTIAIEVIYNMGKAGVVYNGEDDWTIISEDGSLSGLFERTLLVTDKGPELITRRASDKL